ncbi:hypothetical protein Lrub_0625 [Legionella rubrilucens]|uniref:Uncharacterized protein n=1 Tax=Legionella rubrilucens TaxID=458 RepID=A0A0W0XYR8_9GAMM|nr:hypothetical protein Lrub_0625 [Legionella rubrilucens]
MLLIECPRNWERPDICNLLILQRELARPEGFEPPTPWFVARYSIQLSYGRVVLSGGERGIRTLDGISPILP